MNKRYEYKDLLYWCPREVIDGLQGKPVPEVVYPVSWFVVLKNGTCLYLSQAEPFAIRYRALMEGIIDNLNVRAELTQQAAAHMMEFFETNKIIVKHD